MDPCKINQFFLKRFLVNYILLLLYFESQFRQKQLDHILILYECGFPTDFYEIMSQRLQVGIFGPNGQFPFSFLF